MWSSLFDGSKRAPWFHRPLRLAARLAVPAIVIAAAAIAILSWPRDSTQAVAPGEVWTCSMHPQVRLPKPGKCPLCGMTLIQVKDPAKAESAAAPLQFARLEHRDLVREIRTVGRIDYNEARVEEITSRVAGRVDRLYADFTGVRVKEGDHLVDIYSPELYTAQQELRTALQSVEKRRTETESARTGGGSGLDRFDLQLLSSAREKLRLWGLTAEQIAELETSRELKTHLTVYSPLAGTVIQKSVRLGQYLKVGEPLYRIAELETMWLYLELYENEIAWVLYGQKVDVTLEAYPGQIFHGTVVFIDPFLNDETRTIRVRVNLPNPDGRLKAGMYATAQIQSPLRADGTAAPTGFEGKSFCPMHPDVISESPGKCSVCGMDLVPVPFREPLDGQLHVTSRPDVTRTAVTKTSASPGLPLAIPASAVLDTGRRKIAYRRVENGYELAELRLGPRAVASGGRVAGDAFYPVIEGLKAGDEVVVRGGFLLDSQTQIEGHPSLLYPEGRSAANLHSGHAMPTPSSSNASASGHQH